MHLSRLPRHTLTQAIRLILVTYVEKQSVHANSCDLLFFLEQDDKTTRILFFQYVQSGRKLQQKRRIKLARPFGTPNRWSNATVKEQKVIKVLL
jgi:hypothetical protein